MDPRVQKSKNIVGNMDPWNLKVGNMEKSEMWIPPNESSFKKNQKNKLDLFSHKLLSWKQEANFKDEEVAFSFPVYFVHLSSRNL